MTQAAVSYQVKSLEERLGAPLFVREKGRARLTPLGARLLPALSSAFDAIEAAFASHRQEDESLLTITTTHTFANTWLAWRLGGVPDGASRPRGADDHQQRAVRPALRRRRRRDPRRQRRLGGAGGASAVRIRPSRRWPARNASPRSSASSAASSSRATCRTRTCINPSDDWWQQWFSDNGVPADEAVLQARRASASRTRPMKAMRRWPGRASRCSRPCCGKATSPRAGWRCRSRTRFRRAAGPIGWSIPSERRMVPKVKRFREWLLAEMEQAIREADGGWGSRRDADSRPSRRSRT